MTAVITYGSQVPHREMQVAALYNVDATTSALLPLAGTSATSAIHADLKFKVAIFHSVVYVCCALIAIIEIYALGTAVAAQDEEAEDHKKKLK